MKNILKLSLCITIIAYILSSCTPPAYIPSMTNTPVFTGEGEFVMNVGGGTGGGETQVAYSVTNHIGIMFNGSFNDYNKFSDDEIFHKHNFGEFGFGYYNTTNSTVFEIYGGYGFGKIHDRFNGVEMTIATTNKFFIQPNISAFSKHFEISFAPRISLVNINIDGETSGNYDLFIEPTITGRAGFRNMKFFIQSGRIFSTASEELPYRFRSRIFAIGLQLHLGNKEKAK